MRKVSISPTLKLSELISFAHSKTPINAIESLNAKIRVPIHINIIKADVEIPQIKVTAVKTEHHGPRKGCQSTVENRRSKKHQREIEEQLEKLEQIQFLRALHAPSQPNSLPTNFNLLTRNNMEGPKGSQFETSFLADAGKRIVGIQSSVPSISKIHSYCRSPLRGPSGGEEDIQQPDPHKELETASQNTTTPRFSIPYSKPHYKISEKMMPRKKIIGWNCLEPRFKEEGTPIREPIYSSNIDPVTTEKKITNIKLPTFDLKIYNAKNKALEEFFLNASPGAEKCQIFSSVTHNERKVRDPHFLKNYFEEIIKTIPKEKKINSEPPERESPAGKSGRFQQNIHSSRARMVVMRSPTRSVVHGKSSSGNPSGESGSASPSRLGLDKVMVKTYDKKEQRLVETEGSPAEIKTQILRQLVEASGTSEEDKMERVSILEGLIDVIIEDNNKN